MSRRTLSSWRATALVLALWLVQSLSPSSAPAQQTAQVFISQTNAMPGDTVSISIDLANYTPYSFAGFDLLIGFDSSSLSLTSVAQGPLLDQCGWQYFRYHTSGNSDCGDLNADCPSQLLRIVAAADMFGSGHPECFLEGAFGSLVTLTFNIAPTTLSVIELPIRFYWTTCADNSAASEIGNSYFVHNIYDYGTSVPFPPVFDLPSIGGLPESCFGGATQPPIRNLDYHDGAVYITDPLSLRGDLNLNGLANEVSDLVVYRDYFWSGISSFDPDPVHRQRQIVASDVNGNGVPLTFRDLVYLHRIIIGDAIPFPKSSTTLADATIIQDTVAKSVTVFSNSDLAGMLLRFDGLVEPTLLWPGAGGVSGYWQDSVQNTTTAIWLGPERGCCGTGVLLTYSGEGALIATETTDWYDSDVKVRIIVAAAVPTYGDIDGSGSINVADAVFLIAYVFRGVGYPLDPYHGDMDCDGACTVGDIIYLLNYIFASGPTPCGA